MTTNILRVLYDNAVDSAASLAADTTAGALVAANLRNDRKGQVHRATTTAASYTLTWNSAKAIDLVALAFTNLTAAATMRVRGYADPADVVPTLDTGALSCTAEPYAPRADTRGSPPGVALFAQGGFAHARRWLTPGNVFKKLIVDVADSGNPAGYVEAARLLAGAYWSPGYNPDYGAGLTWLDTTKNARDDGGDLRSDKGFRARKLSMSLSQMLSSDRQTFTDLLRVNGLTVPVFVSLFPENADARLEQAYTVYGKLSNLSVLNLANFNRWNWPLELEEV